MFGFFKFGTLTLNSNFAYLICVPNKWLLKFGVTYLLARNSSASTINDTLSLITVYCVTYFSLLFHYLGLVSDRPNIDPNMHAFNSFFFWSFDKLTLSYLVIYQQVRSWIRIRESRDGLSWKRVFSELRLIPAPAVDAGKTPAAFALCRVNLDNSRRCHFRREAISSSRRPLLWLARTPLWNVPEPAAGWTYDVPGSSSLNRKTEFVQPSQNSPALGLPLLRVSVYTRR